MMLDRKQQAPFTIDDLYQAVDEGRLIDLLWKSIDDSGIIELWAREIPARKEMEQALGDAAGALRGREIRKTGVGENALCLVMAFVLEAIQQQHHSGKLSR